jgi:hypothetical protein
MPYKMIDGEDAMKSRLCRLAVTLTALLCIGGTLHEAQGALFISGPTVGAPGDELILSVALDAAVGDADDLTLTLDFDNGVLTGTDASAGALLAGSLFTPNVAAGTGTASFLTTQAPFGPGVVAAWKFKIAADAVLSTQTVVQAHLRTTIIDDETTSDVSSRPFTILVVPEPSHGVLLIVGLVLVGSVRMVHGRRWTA